MTDLLKRLTSTIPNPRQLKWQTLEFYAFIHYGINSFTGREWGTGQESPELFNPQFLDTDQWCDCLAKAGMRAVIVTAKHHDGFCLWDTKHTDYSVMSSPYGKDVVAGLAASCRKYGLKLGVYLSPWDRHDPRYGHGKEYDDYFCNQLTELLQNYGDLFCVWLDGACGEGTGGNKQHYNWERYYDLIYRLQPNIVISVCGPDVRWCGNEAGHCRESEWSVVPKSMADNEKIQDDSQQTDNNQFRQTIPSGSEDIGSRHALRDVDEFIWYPAEVNTSIRPGWFYHADEDSQVRSINELSSIYIQSVGGNASFLLNIPPHPQGYITEYDKKRLEELGVWIRENFRHNLLDGAVFTASSEAKGYPPTNLNQTGKWWKSLENDRVPTVTAEKESAISPHYLVLQEEISMSQRTEEFALYYWQDGDWRKACKGTVIGYKRICLIPEKIFAAKWRLEITSCRCGATLKTFALY